MRRGENFSLLDGLRGIAALAVMFLHAGYILGRSTNLASYLAVDFFFMLSGFVICAAYGRRLETGLSWRRFLLIRLIRLGPMLIIGALLGGSVITFRLLHNDSGMGLLRGLALTIGAGLLLPVGLFWGMGAYPADTPIWSLFFEIVANALYAVKFRARKMTWIVGTFLSAAILSWGAAHLGSIETMGWQNALMFLAGLPRVIVPFAIGVALYSRKAHSRFAGFPAFLPPLALAAILYFHPHAPWIYDLFATLVVFPLIVATAAGSRLGTTAAQVSFISGELSYPFYLIHEPILHALANGEHMAHLRLPFILNAPLALLLALLFSWLLLKYVDKPMRRALDRRFLKDKNQREVMLQPAL